MQAMSLSVILPVRNVEQEISGILRSVVRQTNGIETEFILVDMGSDDGTPLECVQLIKNERLHGFVVQNGDSDVAAALNTGIQKASGTYISLFLPEDCMPIF
ncbi:glycosyltransferase family A protein [Anaeromassilibacillus sp. SJQ-1]|uniref:glycosyltransferase family A protein n=1 Tax=Anaeromassilibacillus sp. SJQ-1 TaxID=3375419 RepID=UPI00398A1DD6